MSAPSSSSAVPGLVRRLNDIRTFQIPRLQQCRGPLSLHAEMADELRQDLDDLARRLDVETEVAEIMLLDDADGRAAEMLEKIEGLKRDHVQCTRSYRSALISSKKAIVAAKGVDSRYELDTARLGEEDKHDPQNGSEREDGTGSTRFAGADDEVQTRTNEVTNALKRTTQVMQAELERSVLSVRMLESSTETLKSTSTLYNTYTSLLSSSSQIVKALEKADWTDRILISGAFLFFLLVVAWILKRRVLDKVVGGVGWWVGGSRKLITMGLKGGKSDTAGAAGKSLGGEVISEAGTTGQVKLSQGASALAGEVATGLPSVDQVGQLATDAASATLSVLTQAASETIASGAQAISAVAGRQHVEL